MSNSSRVFRNSNQRRILRRALFAEQRGRCFYCGCRMTVDHRLAATSPFFATFDHIVPVSNGGRNADNIVLACRACNEARGTLPPDDFKRIVYR